MVTRRLSTSKTNRARRNKAKRSRGSSTRLVVKDRKGRRKVFAPVDYSTMTEYSTPEEESMSMPSMLTIFIVMLMLAGLGVAWFVVVKMWNGEDIRGIFSGSTATKGAVLTSKAAMATDMNKYIAVGIASLMTLFVMVFVYKTFM